MNQAEKLRKAIAGSIKTDMRRNAPVIVEYATVESVEENSCTVQMLTDKEGVLTDGILFQAIGNVTFKPSLQATCLVLHIMNNDAEGMIVWCDKIDQMLINGDDLGGLINAPKLLDELDKLKKFQQKVQQVFQQWVVAPSDGGAALKALSSQFTSMSVPNFADMENEKVKHGQQ